MRAWLSNNGPLVPKLANTLYDWIKGQIGDLSSFEWLPSRARILGPGWRVSRGKGFASWPRDASPARAQGDLSRLLASRAPSTSHGQCWEVDHWHERQPDKGHQDKRGKKRWTFSSTSPVSAVKHGSVIGNAERPQLFYNRGLRLEQGQANELSPITAIYPFHCVLRSFLWTVFRNDLAVVVPGGSGVDLDASISLPLSESPI